MSLTPLRFDVDDPLWPDRDRILCAPDATPLPDGAGTTLPGPPGLAFGAALGLAVGERLMAARFGRSLVDHRTWLIAGAAELAAGTAHEAAAIAGALTLGRLTVLATVPEIEAPALDRFKAVGWSVRPVPAGSAKALEAAISAALRGQKPSLIAVLDHPPSQGRQREPILLSPSPHSHGVRRAWLKRLHRHAASGAFKQATAPVVSHRWHAALAPAPGDPQAPADAAWACLQRAASAVPELTLLPPPAPQHPHRDIGGTTLWAYRPAATSAALLGLALHGGMIPVGRFAATAQDTIRPAERAAAALAVRLVQLLDGDHAADPAVTLEGALRHGEGPSTVWLGGAATQGGEENQF